MLQIKETFVNETKGVILGETPWYKIYQTTKGKLFRSLQKEYGRCESAVYIDRKNAPPATVGWVFKKKMEYEDYRGRGDRYYNREVWVEVQEIA